MTTKIFTTMQMEVNAKSEPGTIVPITFVKHDAGNVEITLSGKYKAVVLNPGDVASLNKFLNATEVFVDG